MFSIIFFFNRNKISSVFALQHYAVFFLKTDTLIHSMYLFFHPEKCLWTKIKCSVFNKGYILHYSILQIFSIFKHARNAFNVFHP